MSTASRSELINSASRGLPYEEALADPDLQAFTVVCNDVLVGNVQVPAYADAILQAHREHGLLSGASDPNIEPTARLVRGNALLNDPTVEKTYLMPLQSLRMIVGSAAITLAAVEHVRGIITDATDTAAPHVTIGFFENHNRQAYYDPRTTFANDYSITGSTSTFGTKVWVADSSVLAPPESAAAIVYPRIVHRLLVHEDSVIHQAALPDIDNAIDYLHDQLRDS